MEDGEAWVVEMGCPHGTSLIRTIKHKSAKLLIVYFDMLGRLRDINSYSTYNIRIIKS
jgi:hypothetical protein